MRQDQTPSWWRRAASAAACREQQALPGVGEPALEVIWLPAAVAGEQQIELARHIAIEVESLAALKSVCAHAKATSVPISFALNHGCSLSAYFQDPEGNILEIFWATGIKTREPIAEPIEPAELERPEKELLDLIGAAA